VYESSKYIAKKKIQEMSADYIWSSFTSLGTKGYVTTPFTQGSLISLLFQSFEVASACFLIFFENISPFSKQIKSTLAVTFSATAEGNAQRNKLSLHA